MKTTGTQDFSENAMMLGVKSRGIWLNGSMEQSYLTKNIGAGDEDRTRNFQLGKLTLYH